MLMCERDDIRVHGARVQRRANSCVLKLKGFWPAIFPATLLPIVEVTDRPAEIQAGVAGDDRSDPPQ
jgi:hypothetical protein